MNATQLRTAITQFTPRQHTRIALELRQTAEKARTVGAHAFGDGLTLRAIDFARLAREADNFTRQG